MTQGPMPQLAEDIEAEIEEGITKLMRMADVPPSYKESIHALCVALHRVREEEGCEAMAKPLILAMSPFPQVKSNPYATRRRRLHRPGLWSGMFWLALTKQASADLVVSGWPGSMDISAACLAMIREMNLSLYG